MNLLSVLLMFLVAFASSRDTVAKRFRGINVIQNTPKEGLEHNHSSFTCEVGPGEVRSGGPGESQQCPGGRMEDCVR